LEVFFLLKIIFQKYFAISKKSSTFAVRKIIHMSLNPHYQDFNAVCSELAREK